MLVTPGLHHFPSLSVALEWLPDSVKRPQALEFKMFKGW